MPTDSVSILDGSTFVVSDRAGDIDAGVDTPHGLLHRDTRFLSRWRLRLDGRPLQVLSTEDVDYFAAQLVLVPSTGTIYQNPSLSVIRQRYVGDGLHEDLVVLNHARQPVEATLRLEVGADFADLFEVEDALQKQGTLYREVRGDELILGYGRGDFVRETAVWARVPPVRDEDGLVCHIQVPPHGEWQTCVEARPRAEQPAHD